MAGNRNWLEDYVNYEDEGAITLTFSSKKSAWTWQKQLKTRILPDLLDIVWMYAYKTTRLHEINTEILWKSV